MATWTKCTTTEGIEFRLNLDHVAVIRPHHSERGFSGSEIIFAAGNLSSIHCATNARRSRRAAAHRTGARRGVALAADVHRTSDGNIDPSSCILVGPIPGPGCEVSPQSPHRPGRTPRWRRPDSVMSTGVPNRVVVEKNDRMPASVTNCSGTTTPAEQLAVGHGLPRRAAGRCRKRTQLLQQRRQHGIGADVDLPPQPVQQVARHSTKLTIRGARPTRVQAGTQHV